MDGPQPGCSKDELDTPALCVDLEVMESNISSMVATCRRHGIAWRPHAKCHKSPEIARQLIQAGACGATCAKLGEAEILAHGGITDLLIANMIVGRQKLARLVALRKRADPIVCLDHLDQAIPLSDAMAAARTTGRALVEIDVGMNRVGCQPGQKTLDLARRIVDLPGIQLIGVMAYEGQLLTVDDPIEKQAAIHAALEKLVATKQLLERSGIPCPVVSCGGTGSYEITAAYPGVTELQAGGGIFMDAFYRRLCHVNDLQYALTILTTVVSRPAPDRAVIDAGRKTLNKEIAMPLVAGREDIEVSRLSAEHGDLSLAPSARGLKIGDRLELIPGYVDLTINLHDEMYGFRGDRLEVVLPISARGRVQ